MTPPSKNKCRNKLPLPLKAARSNFLPARLPQLCLCGTAGQDQSDENPADALIPAFSEKVSPSA
jgi:hypothetical protein